MYIKKEEGRYSEVPSGNTFRKYIFDKTDKIELLN